MSPQVDGVVRPEQDSPLEVEADTEARDAHAEVRLGGGGGVAADEVTDRPEEAGDGRGLGDDDGGLQGDGGDPFEPCRDGC